MQRCYGFIKVDGIEQERGLKKRTQRIQEGIPTQAREERGEGTPSPQKLPLQGNHKGVPLQVWQFSYKNIWE